MLLTALFFSSLTGILIWYVQSLANASFSGWFGVTMRWISFFTNLTNALVVCMAFGLLRQRGRLYEWFKSPATQSAFCLYITFVGLAFWFLLGGPQTADSVIDWTAELTAHTLSPILGVVFWLWAVPRGQLNWRHPLLWLAYPVGYLIYWLFRGPLVGYYPYFFIDVNALGYGGVALWTLALIAVFLMLGLLMWMIDRRR